MDHLEAVRVFGKMDDAERDTAIDDLIELVVAVDGLIQKQTDLDVRNFAKYAGRVLTDEENQTLHDSVLKAKRYTFIESGVAHPNFLALFGEVSTPAQQEKGADRLGDGTLALRGRRRSCLRKNSRHRRQSILMSTC